MKKIILLLIAVLTIITITVPAYAYDTGSNVLTNNSYTITYTSSPLGSSGRAIKISIAFNGDAIGYDTLVINGIYNVGYIYDTSTTYSGIGQGYSPQATETDWSIYYQGQTQPILRPANVVKTLTEPIKANTIIELYYFYNTTADNFNQAVSAIKTTVSIILIDGGAGYSEGYRTALQDSELYYNNKIQQMQEMLENEATTAYDLAKNEFGIYYNGEWLTAQQFGDLQYQLGIQANPNENALAVMFGGLASLFGVGLAFILQLGSIELMGISLNMILGIGLLLVGLIAILGLIFGGK